MYTKTRIQIDKYLVKRNPRQRKKLKQTKQKGKIEEAMERQREREREKSAHKRVCIKKNANSIFFKEKTQKLQNKNGKWI